MSVALLLSTSVSLKVSQLACSQEKPCYGARRKQPYQRYSVNGDKLRLANGRRSFQTIESSSGRFLARVVKVTGWWVAEFSREFGFLWERVSERLPEFGHSDRARVDGVVRERCVGKQEKTCLGGVVSGRCVGKQEKKSHHRVVSGR